MSLKPLLVGVILITTIPAFCSNGKAGSDTTGYNAIIPVSKQNLLRDIDVIMNMQYGFAMNMLTENIREPFQHEPNAF